MGCFEPSARGTETGMVDLSEVYRHLPDGLKQTYLHALNRFYFITRRPLNALDRLVLARSPLKVVGTMSDGRAKLAALPTPTVCLHPETGEPCIQPWAFARNTNTHAHAAALACFEERGDIERCASADTTRYIWDLCDDHGRAIGWSADDQRALFDEIYRRSTLVEWQRGDVALVDNVRVGHWRMNGKRGPHRLMQLQLESFNALAHRTAFLPRSANRSAFLLDRQAA